MLKEFLNLLAPPSPAGSVWACEKPTTTLCKMIAATMLSDLPPISSATRVQHSKFDVEFIYCYRNPHDSSRDKMWKVHTVYRPERLDLDDREKTILVRAFERLQKLHEEKRKADAETHNQERAVNALADWMGVSSIKETDSVEILSSGTTSTAG